MKIEHKCWWCGNAASEDDGTPYCPHCGACGPMIDGERVLAPDERDALWEQGPIIAMREALERAAQDAPPARSAYEALLDLRLALDAVIDSLRHALMQIVALLPAAPPINPPGTIP